jgi:hypothetical protein
MSFLLTEFMSASQKFSVFIEIDFVVADRCWRHPAQDLLLAPVVVEMIEVPEFPPEMAEEPELLECDMVPVKCFVIALDLSTTTRVIRPAASACSNVCEE